MKKKIIPVIAVLVFFLTGCEALTGTMPTIETTDTPAPKVTSTPVPTLGEMEPLDAAYCMESAPDAHETEFSVLRFFPSGVVLHVTVKGQYSCAETWDYISDYLSETATDIYSHGEYQYSDGQIQFALAPPGLDETAGTVAGRIEGNEMILNQQGTEMVYVCVYGGE